MRQFKINQPNKSNMTKAHGYLISGLYGNVDVHNNGSSSSEFYFPFMYIFTLLNNVPEYILDYEVSIDVINGSDQSPISVILPSDVAVIKNFSLLVSERPNCAFFRNIITMAIVKSVESYSISEISYFVFVEMSNHELAEIDLPITIKSHQYGNRVLFLCKSVSEVVELKCLYTDSISTEIPSAFRKCIRAEAI